MAKRKPGPAPKDKTSPELHEELKGFDIRINEFGEIVSSFSVDKLNEFLNDKVDDKKLRGRKPEGEASAEEEA